MEIGGKGGVAKKGGKKGGKRGGKKGEKEKKKSKVNLTNKASKNEQREVESPRSKPRHEKLLFQHQCVRGSDCNDLVAYFTTSYFIEVPGKLH